MISITFDVYQTLAIAVVALIIGDLARKKISVLNRFCIPSPVIGGMLFAVLVCILHCFGIADIVFEDDLREICMVFFFTSVGFQADIKLLRTGGKDLVKFLFVVALLIVLQNTVAVSLAKAMGLGAGIGLCTGSIPMVGGHGTASAFGPLLEKMGTTGARTISTAVATYGLVAGSLLGGPIANRLIKKHDLLKTVLSDSGRVNEEEKLIAGKKGAYAYASFQLAIAAGAGTVISFFISKTGMTFPVYIGAMIAAAIIRNVAELSGKLDIHTDGINDIGGIMLSLFLGMAMISLKIWELAGLALPLVILVAAQTVLMAVFAYFVAFTVMGRDYDAAVISSGTCGFGMGATPNAMANIQAVCDTYAPSLKAFLIIPVVGSMFADFINSFLLTLFINFM